MNKSNYEWPLNSQIYHFADDTNLLLIDKSPPKIKLINQDLSKLCIWLQANTISLNASKTEIILFKTKTKIVTKKFNFRFSGQKINLTEQVKYLGLLISDTLTWDSYQTSLINELSCAIGLKRYNTTPQNLCLKVFTTLFLTLI